VTVDFLGRDADFGNAFRDALRMVCWLIPEVMVQKVGDLIDSLPQLGEPLGNVARSRALAALDCQLLGLERAEESVITALEEQGVPHMRRENASPLAVLNLRPKMAAVAAA
jgi:hypothetical protein